MTRMEKLTEGIFPLPSTKYTIYEIDGKDKWFEMSFSKKSYAENYIKDRSDRKFVVEATRY